MGVNYHRGHKASLLVTSNRSPPRDDDYQWIATIESDQLNTESIPIRIHSSPTYGNLLNTKSWTQVPTIRSDPYICSGSKQTFSESE